MTDEIEQYILSHSDDEPPQLATLYRQTHLQRLYPRMCCEPLQGRLLAMLTHMIKPKRILELGTFSGYATLCFAEAMPAGAEIHTVEIDDEAEEKIRRELDKSERRADIHLHLGDALTLIGELSDEPWDLVYIDANKRFYSDYYRLVKPHVAPGGYIIADNTLWSDFVIDSNHNDPQTQGVRAFNNLVKNDPDMEVVILPLYDGLSIIRKKP